MISKISQQVGVHQFGLSLFGVIMWKIFISESFSQWKLNKIILEFGGIIGVVEKPWTSQI